MTVKNTLSTTEKGTKQLTKKNASSALNTNVCSPHHTPHVQSKKCKQAKKICLVLSTNSRQGKKKRRNSEQPLRELVVQGKMNQTAITDKTWYDLTLTSVGIM